MKVSRTLDDMLNRAPNRHAAYVGESAFVTKTGIHASAVLKDPQTYEHVTPELVGNHRKVLVSDQAGRSNVIAELDRAGIAYDKSDPKLARLVEELKEREAQGFAYESANASFDLLARRTLGKVPEYFRVEQFDVNVEQRYNANGQRVTVALAVVKVDVAGEHLISAAEGNGPVNALDVALRKDLGKYQNYIEGPEADRLSRAYPQRRHRSGHARADRERGRGRRALDHGRRVAEHHRRLVPGADGLGDLQAGEIGRAGVGNQRRHCERSEAIHTAAQALDCFACPRNDGESRGFSMIDHVSVGVADLERAARFYEAALAALGLTRLVTRPARSASARPIRSSGSICATAWPGSRTRPARTSACARRRRPTWMPSMPRR